MVELTGIEPATSGVQNRRSPNLSYSPKNWLPGFLRMFNPNFQDYYLVGLSGLEPLTSRLSGVRSNQLSYRPLAALIHLVRACQATLTS